MDDLFNRISLGDCVEQLDALPASCIDLAFADPPFNIGYDYDVYEDDVEHEQYIKWSTNWMAAIHRVLKPNGTFWLAIGDEYAAELKLASQGLGFHCRSWVIWYYTFGVNCSKKFTRSHAHLFHFVKNPQEFTFRDDDLDNRVPSARELVYNDKRANPKGRLPDDTWIIRPADAVGELTGDDDGSWSPQAIAAPEDNDRTYALRPQDLDQCFQPEEDTWYFPRVAGTFKERAGFHGCQMPEQLLGRIIRTCSHPGDVVLDPFSGSATTLAVAKKLGRKFLGFDVSEDYVRYGIARLEALRVGDRLDGSPEPLKSAPKTGARSKQKKKPTAGSSLGDNQASETWYDKKQRDLTELGVIEAFRRTHEGFSADRVVTDPDRNQAFTDACSQLGLVGDARTWNMLLFGLRKQGRLSEIETSNRTSVAWEECENYIFASEVAWQSMLNAGAASSLDEILCDPALAADFDRRASELAPGSTSLDYRWTALKLRKEAKSARSRASVLKLPARLGSPSPLGKSDPLDLPNQPGLYVLLEKRGKKFDPLYAGETTDLANRINLTRNHLPAWRELSGSISVQTLAMDSLNAGRLAWQSCLVKKLKPRLNCFELGG